MRNFLYRLFDKFYREIQNFIDNILFSPITIKKDSFFYKSIIKYGVLRIFPNKNTYFNYLENLGKDLKLNIKIKIQKNNFYGYMFC